jgi:hypothetical protein
MARDTGGEAIMTLKTGISVRLVRINDMKIRVDEELTFEDLLKDKERRALKAIIDNLARRGIDLYKPRLKVREVHDFIPYWIQQRYPGYNVKNTEQIGLQHPGYPDYELTDPKTGRKVFIEVKINMDGLRKTQIKWFSQHKDAYECYILYVKTPEETESE